MFVAACSYSLASGSVKADATLGADDRLERQRRYRAKANQLLVKAREIGLFKDPIYLRQMEEDSDFEPMMGDPEFDRFLDGLRRSRRALP